MFAMQNSSRYFIFGCKNKSEGMGGQNREIGLFFMSLMTVVYAN